MISKYYLWTSALIVSILLFSSCLGSNEIDRELPTDPQIYSFSLASKTDTNFLLPEVVFTIDQIKGEIFNKEPLPYEFHVDSAIIKVSGSSNYYSLSGLELSLAPLDPLKQDCTYYWNFRDSIPLPRLKEIKSIAPDGVATKEYSFQLNIYQQDPYIIDWKEAEIKGNYLTPPVESQKSIACKNRFFTYYSSGTEIKASSAPISDAPQWEAVALSGIPHTLRLSTLIATDVALYALDGVSGKVYKSDNGADWSPVKMQTGIEVVALYGELPSDTPGNILLAVKQEGTHKFALTKDFLKIEVMNDLPENVPVKDFSAINVENKSSFGTRFIILSGGAKANDNPNKDIWLIEQGDDKMNVVSSEKLAIAEELGGSSLFFYDNKPYLIAKSGGKNLLLHSENNGTSWIESGENQAFPSTFTVRTEASVITDANNNIWIFGGVSSNSQLVDIWKGRLNKFTTN